MLYKPAIDLVIVEGCVKISISQNIALEKKTRSFW